MWKILCGVGLFLFALVELFLLQTKPLAQMHANTPTVAKSTPALDSLPAPLPAERFTGRTREAYQAAADIPDVLAALHCYCGCDKSLGHRSLLDCFVDDHGAG
jgi:hypothetical protein